MENIANEDMSQSATDEPNPQVVPEVQANPEFGSFRLCRFWKDRPKLWFVQLEYQFVAYGVRSDDAKLGIVLRHLDEDTTFDIADALEQLPESNKYEHVKAALIQKYSECLVHNLAELEAIQLGDATPSMLLHEIRTLAGSDITNYTLRKLWLEKLDVGTKELLLVVQNSMTLDKLAKYADMVQRRVETVETTPQWENEAFDRVEVLTDRCRDQILSMVGSIRRPLSKIDDTVEELTKQVEEFIDQMKRAKSANQAISRNNNKTIKDLIEQVQRLTMGNGPLSSVEPESKNDARFKCVHLDLISQLDDTTGYNHCLVMVDHYTRWPEATPIVDGTAETVAEAFFTTWVSRFGVPKTITMYKNSQFKGTSFIRLANLLGCNRIELLPESNDFVDQWHYTLRHILHDELKDNEDWVLALSVILLGLRTANRADLGCSPSAKLYDKNLKLPNAFFEDSSESDEPDTFIQDLRDNMFNIRPRCYADFIESSTKFELKKLREATHVFVRDNGRNDSSLLPPYDGPFKVLERTNRCSYILLVHGNAVEVPVERLRSTFEEISVQDEE